MKSLKTSCLKCHESGEVLVCSDQGCPTVVHERCMPCAAHFDDTGCFYCPYCLYKQSLVERDQAREKALLARRSLVGFLDTRIRNDAGHLNNSNSLKRKKPEAPTIVKERKDASCVKDDFNRVHQSEQLKHQDDSRFCETLSCNNQQVGLTKGRCLGKGSVTKDNGFLAGGYQFSLKKVEGYKAEKQEKVQTLPGFRIVDGTKETYEKTDNRSGDCGLMEDTVLVSKKSINPNEGTAKTVERNYDAGVEMDKAQTDPGETPWCSANKNPLRLNEKLYKRNALQVDCFARTQLLENFGQPAENWDDCSSKTGKDESKAKAAVFLVRNECESLPCRETKNMSVTYPQDEQTEVKQSESRECFPRSERVNNSGNADQSAVIGNGCNGSVDRRAAQENALQDPVQPTREGKTEVIHELGNRTRKHPISPKKLEKCLNGVEEIEQTGSELRSTRDGDKKETAEEFDAEKCSSVQDECFLKRERRLCGKNIDRIACIREGRCGKTSEGQVEIVKNAPNMTENEKESVSYEEFGSVDDTESRNTDYLPHRIHAVKKRQMKKNLKNVAQHGESSGCSENDLATHGESKPKVKSIKQIQQSTSFPNAKRKKLPWTVQEVKMLEEGVKIFSLKANKNLPWLKILEFGRHVFDGTRTSADLKDKWKRMKAK